MIRIYFFLFFFVSSPMFAETLFNVKMSSMQIKNVSKNSYSVKFSVSHKGLEKIFFQDNKLLLTTERIIVKGEMPDYSLKESDFLYAQMRYDLNNDNDYKDVFKLIKRKNVYYINGNQLKLIMPASKFSDLYILNVIDNRGVLNANQISNNGLSFLIYNINYKSKIIKAGLSTVKHPIKIKEFPNPAIKIMLIKTVGRINSAIKYSISGMKNQIAYSNEKIFDDQEDAWTGIVWAVKSLSLKTNKPHFSITAKNISPPFAVKVVAYLSMEKGISLNTDPYIKIVEQQVY